MEEFLEEELQFWFVDLSSWALTQATTNGMSRSRPSASKRASGGPSTCNSVTVRPLRLQPSPSHPEGTLAGEVPLDQTPLPPAQPHRVHRRVLASLDAGPQRTLPEY